MRFRADDDDYCLLHGREFMRRRSVTDVFAFCTECERCGSQVSEKPVGGSAPARKDFRTPEAKKWPDDFIPPETCTAIDDAQNALEHLRDTNSQLRHAAHYWKRQALNPSRASE